MNKPFHLLTANERTAYRIARNRAIDERIGQRPQRRAKKACNVLANLEAAWQASLDNIRRRKADGAPVEEIEMMKSALRAQMALN